LDTGVYAGAEQVVDRCLGGHDVELGVQHERGVRHVIIENATQQVQQCGPRRLIHPGVGESRCQTGAQQILFVSRSATPSASARRSTMSRLGVDRPVST